MPLYSYICSLCDKKTTEFRAIADRDNSAKCDCGGLVKRDFADELAYVNVIPPGVWPKHNDALGVNPSQRREAYDHSAKFGVPTEFDEEGRAVFRDAGHEKRYCKLVSNTKQEAMEGE